jgi:hypothetical protein
VHIFKEQAVRGLAGKFIYPLMYCKYVSSASSSALLRRLRLDCWFRVSLIGNGYENELIEARAMAQAIIVGLAFAWHNS